MRRAAPAVPRRKRADLRRGPGDASERTPGSPPGAGPRRGPAGSADGRRHPPHVGRSRRPHPRLIVIPRSRQPRIPCTPTEWPPTGRGPLGRAPSADRRSRVDRCRPVRGVEIADDHVHPGTVGGGAAHRRPDPAGEIGQRLAVAAVDLHEDPVSPHPHPRDPATRQVRRHLSPPEPVPRRVHPRDFGRGVVGAGCRVGITAGRRAGARWNAQGRGRGGGDEPRHPRAGGHGRRDPVGIPAKPGGGIPRPDRAHSTRRVSSWLSSAM